MTDRESSQSILEKRLTGYLNWAYSPYSPENADKTNVEEAQSRLVRRVADAAVLSFIAFVLSRGTKGYGSEEIIKAKLIPFTNNIDKLMALPDETLESTLQKVINASRYGTNKDDNAAIIYPFRYYANIMEKEAENSLRQEAGEASPLNSVQMREALTVINDLLGDFMSIKIAPKGYGAKSEGRARTKIKEKIVEAQDNPGKEHSIYDLARISVVYKNTQHRAMFWQALSQIDQMNLGNYNHSLHALTQQTKMQKSGFLATYGLGIITDSQRWEGRFINVEIQSQHIAMDRVYGLTHVLQEIERDIDAFRIKLEPNREQEIIQEASKREGQSMITALHESGKLNDFLLLEKRYQKEVAALLARQDIPSLAGRMPEIAEENVLPPHTVKNTDVILNEILNNLKMDVSIDQQQRDKNLKVAFVEKMIQMNASFEQFKKTYNVYKNTATNEISEDLQKKIINLKRECFEFRQLVHTASVMSKDVEEVYQNKWAWRLQDMIAKKYHTEDFSYLMKLLLITGAGHQPRPKQSTLAQSIEQYCKGLRITLAQAFGDDANRLDNSFYQALLSNSR